MRTVLIKIFFALLALTLVGCGKSSEENNVPQASDPNKPPAVDGPDAGTGGVKSGVPTITGFAYVTLANKTGNATDGYVYPDLETLFGIVYGNLVGNAAILDLNLSNAGVTSGVTQLKTRVGTDANTGKALQALTFGFEDQSYFQFMQQNVFAGAATLSSTALDVITQDDNTVMRVTADRSGVNLNNGQLLFRVRSASDALVTYTYTGGTPTYQAKACTPFTWMCGSTACTFQNDTVTPCKNYMSSGNAAVKTMGTFDAKPLTDWIN